MTGQLRDSLTPEQVLEILKEGNRDFARGEWRDWDFLHETQQTADGQHPMAVILGCIDSRAPAEIVFNLGIGDVFNARVAGNFVNPDIAGSMEYACKVAGSRLVLVLGHSHCGAVKSACDGVELGNVTAMLANITPAVEAVQDVPGPRNSTNAAFVAAVAKQNVLDTVERIRVLSPILAELERDGAVVIAGAMYDVETGIVEFY